MRFRSIIAGLSLVAASGALAVAPGASAAVPKVKLDPAATLHYLQCRSWSNKALEYSAKAMQYEREGNATKAAEYKALANAMLAKMDRSNCEDVLSGPRP